MSSSKASLRGLSLVKQAIAQKGWRVRDDRWLVAASYQLEPEGDWRSDGPYAYGCSLQTWERFLQRVAIRDRSFIAFCKALNLPPNQIAESTLFRKNQPFDQQADLAAQAESYLPLIQELLAQISLLEHRMRSLEHRLDKNCDCRLTALACDADMNDRSLN